MIKRGIKSLVDRAVAVMRRTRPGRYAALQIVDTAMHQTRNVVHRGTTLTFAVPNALNEDRVVTFASKEPETLEWIDGMERGAVLWDIGANVGLYSCYAARARGLRVFAFEPSVFNLELLARNTFLNQVTDKVTLVPLPLTDRLQVSTLTMSTTDWGGALSTFGEAYGYDGRALAKRFAFATIGVSMQDAAGMLGIPVPDYVKLDVDGIEHLILRGAGGVLARVKSVLVELNDEFRDQSSSASASLAAAGLELERRASVEAPNHGAAAMSNQIWIRPGSR